MENLWSKMTQVGEEDKKPDITTMEKALDKNLMESKNLAQIFVGVNGRQFEAQSSSVPKQEKSEASNAQEQGLPMASMQEKMDQNSKETSTTVSYILKKIERIDKELVAAKSDNLTGEMLEIDVIDSMRDIISELKNNVGDLIRVLQMNKEHTSTLAYQLWVVKDDVKKVTKNLKDFQEEEDLEDEALKNDIMDVRDEISEVRHKMSEVKNTLKDLERRGDELMDVKAEVKSLKDAVKNVTNEFKSVKDVGANLEEDVTSKMNIMKEELRVVKEKMKDENAGQNEMEGVQEGMLYKLRKVADEVSCAKQDLRDIWVEVTDKCGMGVGGRLQDVRHELKNIRYEMRAAKDEQIQLTDADLDLIKEFNDIVRSAQTNVHAQNVKLTLDELRDTFREVMTNVIRNKKRKQDSRHPTFKQNKKLQKQSNHSNECATASTSSASGFSMFALSSNSSSSDSSSSDSSSSDSDSN